MKLNLTPDQIAILKGVGLGLVEFAGILLAAFGIACLCSKKVRAWAEGRPQEPKPWNHFEWRPKE